MENNKTNDWFASIMFNPTKDVSDFLAAGFDQHNTGLQSRDYYLNNQKVRDEFVKDTGEFDEIKFNQFYDSAQRTYSDFIVDKVNNDFLDEQLYSSRNIEIDQSKKTRKNRFDLINIRNPQNLTTGTNSLFGISESPLSSRERAQNNKIWDTKTNSWSKYSPNDPGVRGVFGVMKRLWNVIGGDTLVLATYDEDGEYTDEYGRQIKYKKGDLKFNEDGSEYYETLGNRSPYGKDILHPTDVLTVDGSTLNKFDFFDSDSKEKSVTGITMKMIAKLAPFFIKGIKTPYAYLTAGEEFGKAVASMSKSIDDLFTSDSSEKSKVWKTLNGADKFLRKFETSTTDEAQNKPWGWENMSTMINDIVGQLYQQRAVAQLVRNTPSLVGLSKNEVSATRNLLETHNPKYLQKYGKSIQQAIKDGSLADDYKYLFNTTELAHRYNKISKLGESGANLSKMYMALTQTTPIYETMDEAGYSDLSKVIGVAASIYGFNKIFQSELGDVALQGMGFDDVAKITKRFYRENATKINSTINKISKNGLDDAVKMSMIKRVGNNLKRYYDYMVDHPNIYLNSAFKESVEEISEEALQDVILSSLGLMDNTFRALSGSNEQNTYSFTESNPIERYLMSAFGGAIGGGVFTAINNLENRSQIHKNLDSDSRKELLRLIRNGKTNEIISIIDDMTKKHKTGLSSTLSTRLSENVSETDGKDYWMPTSDYKDSQEAVFNNSIKGYIQSLDAVINNEGLAIFDDDIIAKAFAKDARLEYLSDNGFDFKILDDVNNNLLNLIDAKLELNDVKEGETNQFANQKYAEARKALDAILSGERSSEYTERLQFSMSPAIHSEFMDSNIELYALSIGRNYESASPNEKKQIEDLYNRYLSNNNNIAQEELAFQAYKLLKPDFNNAIKMFRDNLVEVVDPQTGQVQLDANGIPVLKREDKFSKYMEEFQKIFTNERAELTSEQQDTILERFRRGKTDSEILLEMNPDNLPLNNDQRKKKIREWLLRQPGGNDTSGRDAIQELAVASASKWLRESYKAELLSNTSMKLGIDTMISLKSLDQLHDVIEKINLLRTQNEINFIDTRTNDALTKIIDANNNFDFKDTIKNYLISNIGNINNIPNIVDIILSQGRLDFEYDLGIGEVNLSIIPGKNGELLTKNSNGDDIFSAFDSETGDVYEITLNELSEILINQLPNINGIEEFLNYVNNNKSNISLPNTIISKVNDLIGSGLQFKYDLIKEAQNLQSNILRNPIYNALDNLSSRILGDSIFNILGREETEFQKLSKLDEYVLSGDSNFKRDKLYKAHKFLRLFKNLLNSSVESTSDFSFNEAIKYFKQHYQKLNPRVIDNENPTISSEIKAIIDNDLDNISEKIEFLIYLNDTHNASKFSDSKKTQVRINSLLIKILSGNNDKFKPLVEVTVDEERLFDYVVNDSDMSDINKYLENSDEQSDEAILKTEKILTDIKHNLYIKFNSIQSEEKKQQVIKDILKGVNYDLLGINSITQFLEAEDLQIPTIINIIISSISNDTSKFRTQLLEILPKFTDKAPFYTQLMNLETIVAFSENSDWFNFVVNELRSQTTTEHFSDPNNEKLYESITNTLLCWGDQGSGKTSMIAKTLAAYINKNNLGKLWVGGPNLERALNMSSATDVKEAYDKNSLFKNILTQEGLDRYSKMIEYLKSNEKGNGKELRPKDKINITINDQEELLASNFRNLADSYINNTHFKSSDQLPKIIILDEITKFDTFEIQILNRSGIKVIGLGDRKQMSQSLYGESHNVYSYINTPEIAMSVRANNIHKKDNQSKITSLIRILLDKQAIDNNQDLSNIFNSQINDTQFSYYEAIDDEGITLHGEKIVDSLSNDYIGKLIQTLEDGKKLAYIYDDVSKAQELKSKFGDKIEIVTLDEVQGKEYQYVIVDIRYTNIDGTNSVQKNEQMVTALKEFNTAIGRSEDGTIIITNETSPYKLKNSEAINYTNPSKIDEKSINDFAEKTFEIIRNSTPESVELIQQDPSKSEESVSESILEYEDFKPNHESNPDFIRTHAGSYSFYNHMSMEIQGNNYIPSGIAEDLGQFDINSSKNRKLKYQKLRKQLAYLRSYAMMKASGNTISENIVKLETDNLSEFVIKYFNKNIDRFALELQSGVFKIKMTDANNAYSKSHGNINKKGWKQGDLLSRIVYQIKDINNNTYDITIGALSSDFAEEILTKSGKTKPIGSEIIYYNFNNSPTNKGENSWNVGYTGPLLNDDYDINGSITLDELIESTPELMIGDASSRYKVLLTPKQMLPQLGGKPFIIYTWNLFHRYDNRKDSVALAYLRDNDNKAVPQTGRLLLDRIGYTLDEWFEQAEDGGWFSKNMGDVDYFTGDMTAPKFAISLYEYSRNMIDSPKKTSIENFLKGRIDTTLFSSRFLKLSKTLESTETLVKWLDNEANMDSLINYLNKDSDTFNREDFMDKFLTSWDKVYNAIIIKYPNLNAKNIFEAMSRIKGEILKGSTQYGSITPEDIDLFKSTYDQFSNMLNTNMKKTDAEGRRILNDLTGSMISNGILVKATRKQKLLKDFYDMWQSGSVQGNDGTRLDYGLTKSEFQDIFKDAIKTSRFFRNGMIYREGRQYIKGSSGSPTIGKYYLDSNPSSNFITDTRIQPPALYFSRNSVNLTPETVQNEEINKPKQTYNISESKEEVIKSESISNKSEIVNNIISDIIKSQPRNQLLNESLNDFLNNELIKFNSDEQIVNRINAIIFDSPWHTFIGKYNEENVIFNKPKLEISNKNINFVPNISDIFDEYNPDGELGDRLKTLNLISNLNGTLSYTDSGITYNIIKGNNNQYRLEKVNDDVDKGKYDEVFNNLKESYPEISNQINQLVNIINPIIDNAINTALSNGQNVKTSVDQALGNINIDEIIQTTILQTTIDPEYDYLTNEDIESMLFDVIEQIRDFKCK